jgi:hypothetical protein
VWWLEREGSTNAGGSFDTERHTMSIFSKLAAKIFGRGEETFAGPAAAPVAPVAATAAAVAAPVAVATAVDVEAVLEEMAAKNPQKLNWRTSIVDLMKLVGMESSLAERKELAQELGYTGSTQDTATMNVWLHKQVLQKLAENGGKVPANLLD